MPHLRLESDTSVQTNSTDDRLRSFRTQVTVSKPDIGPGSPRKLIERNDRLSGGVQKRPTTAIFIAAVFMVVPGYADKFFVIGSLRIVLPVAARSALATAGPIGGTPGSPTPVGGSSDGTMCTSTRGICSILSGV